MGVGVTLGAADSLALYWCHQGLVWCVLLGCMHAKPVLLWKRRGPLTDSRCCCCCLLMLLCTGYWPSDFYKTNPAFGSKEDLLDLLKAYQSNGELL